VQHIFSRRLSNRFVRIIVSSLISRNPKFLGVGLLLPMLLAGLQAQTAHFSPAQVALGGGFGAPYGVAVDGSGDVFVADKANSAVKEIPYGCASAGCVETLGSGFSAPSGVAVDGSGNVYVADTGNSLVKEMLAVSGSIPASPTINTLGSGFSGPTGIVLDPSGNVYVGDTGNNAVKEMLAVGGSIPASPTINTLGTGFSGPTGLALDYFGDVYVADTGNGLVRMIEVQFGVVTGTIFTLGSGFAAPSGVAVDGSFNVYVADTGNNAVKEMLAVGGAIPLSPTIFTLGSGFNTPYGVAVDVLGNVFVGDSGNGRVVEVETTSVDFGPVAVGQASAKISVPFTFDTGGSIGKPVVLTQSVAGLDFADAGTGSCTTNGTGHTYSIGDSCTVDVTFTPTLAGLREGAAILQDGSSNTIATGYIHGIGSGPQVSFLPGSQSTLGSGFNSPEGVAVDGLGDVFVVDTGNSSVKEMLAVNGSIPALPTINTLASGLATPLGIAVDGSGNVFFADALNDAVKEILAVDGSIPATPTINIIGSGFSRPQGPAVDGSGNVFLADTDHGSVKEILAAGGYTTVNTLAGGFNYPLGVAVDRNGNVIVADTYNNAVKEIILTAGAYATVKTIGSGFNFPTGVAVDANGNVFVADANNGAVKEILAASDYSTVVTLGSGFSNPFSVAVDGSGNVYVAELGNNSVVKLDYADAPALSFATPTSVGTTDTTDGPQTVTLQNIGNTTLTFQPFVAGNLLDAILTSSGATDCTTLSGLQLAPGVSCTLDIEFAPAVSGSPVTGYVNVVDNALNAASPNYATQTIAVQGTGFLGTTPQTINFPNPGTQTYGVAPFALGATASSGLTVNYSVTSGPASVVGSTLTITGVGSVTVQSTQAGDGTYVPATPVSVTFTVSPAVLTVVVNNQAAAVGSGIPALTGSVTGAAAGDGITVSYATTAVTGSPAGTYPITATMDPNSKLPNYIVSITNGTLAIFNPTVYPLALLESQGNAVAGGPGFTLAVTGANFGPGSVVLWNGMARATLYVSSTQLTVQILAGDILAEGTNLVTVANGAPNAGTSAALVFVVQSSSPMPAITGASVANAADGSGNHTLSLTGTGLVPGSTVLWNGVSLATTVYVSPWEISAVVTSSDYGSLPAVVTVENPSGALSAGVQLH
jgi:sugar lactone lactonase YvrE